MTHDYDMLECALPTNVVVQLILEIDERSIVLRGESDVAQDSTNNERTDLLGLHNKHGELKNARHQLRHSALTDSKTRIC